MNKNELLYEYFTKQKEILSLLEESNNIVLELIKDDHCCDNSILDDDYAIEEEDGDHLYMLRYHDSRNRRKYIQFDNHKYIKSNYNLGDVIVRPLITTKTGYRAGCNVMFYSKNDAKEFFKKFMNSKSRRYIDEYEMNAWKIVNVPKRALISQPLRRHWDTEYGWFTV